jgi:ribosomal-protein-serine acetyltransferase
MEKRLKKIVLPLRISDKIILDMILEKDKHSFYNLIDMNRSYLRQGVLWLDRCKTINETLLFIERSLKDTELDNAIRLGIFFSGKLIGSIIATANWQHQYFEIGYWIDQTFQGRGIITMSCAPFLEKLYQEFGIKKAFIHCALNNGKSQSVAKKLGFSQQGTLTHRMWVYDHYDDYVWYERPLP